MNEPHVTVVGHVAAPPVQRVTPGGVAVAAFRVAATPRRQDKASGDWSDLETLWFSVSAWRSLAAHCAASLRKGDRVVVTGRLTARTWVGNDGQSRTSWEVDAGTVSLDLARNDAVALRPDPAGDTWVSTGQVDPETGEVLVALAEDEPPVPVAA